MNTERQNQHRVPQVYLKQFGYCENRKWYVSALNRIDKSLQHIPIQTFTAEINVFDYELIPEIALRRSYEKTCQLVENDYRKILSTISSQRKLIPKHRSLLCHFIASLIGRSKPFRNLVSYYLKDRDARESLVAEFTMLRDDNMADLFDVIIWEGLDLESQSRMVSAMATEHFAHAFHRFNFVILESPTLNGRAWLTSDNPVVIDRNNNQELILPPEAEIYLPLSPRFCLFVFHPGSKDQTNPLRKLRKDRVSQANITTHGMITMKIGDNEIGHIILPGRIEEKDIH